MWQSLMWSDTDLVQVVITATVVATHAKLQPLVVVLHWILEVDMFPVVLMCHLIHRLSCRDIVLQ